ncbi:MAG: peptidylprolyl isomerase [archaeon]
MDSTSKKDIDHINKLAKAQKRPSKAVHKTHRRKVEKKEPKKKSLTWLWIVLGVVVVAVVIAFIYSQVQQPPAPSQNTAKIAAIVNGEKIMLDDLQDQYDRLPAQIKSLYTLSSFLNQTIEEKLLLQEAARQDIITTDDQVREALDSFITERGLTQADLEGLLAQQGVTMQYFTDLIKKQLTLTALFNKTIFNEITVSDEDVQAYYDRNSAAFEAPEQVTVKHILVSNATQEEPAALVEELKANISDGADFCTLVTEYTEDPGSKDKCGEYTFPRGVMVPEFEDAAFSLDDGDMAIVQTQFGYHLILKVETIAANPRPFSEVSDEIKNQLTQEKSQQAYIAYLDELKAKANILILLDEEIVSPAKLAACLTAQGAKMYGAYWCGHCANQKELFGDAAQDMPYVECAIAENPQEQTDACKEAGISGYPTWIINGQKYEGEQSLESLKSISGCA